MGPVVAAQLLISWSHPGRVRSEAAFASLAGVAPLEASSGQHTRHRLNRGGDRALNRALHTVAITRIRCHAETRAYKARCTQGLRGGLSFEPVAVVIHHPLRCAARRQPIGHHRLKPVVSSGKAKGSDRAFGTGDRKEEPWRSAGRPHRKTASNVIKNPGGTISGRNS